MSRARRFKRGFDVVGAAGGLLIFGPVMALIAVAILLDDGAPVFFRQDRLGYQRRRFSIFKFRTMLDGRVTRVGAILRKTGLDEIPQFVNILRGEMSAVGPRPLTDADVRRLGWEGSPQDFRWTSRPGLTGLAQILGASTPEQALELDRRYLETQSLRLDCTLIAWSFAVNAFGKARVHDFAAGLSLKPHASSLTPRIR